MYMEFIEQLKAEHQVILSAFEEAKVMGVGSETSLAKLLKIKELLLSHLHKEDQELYPALTGSAMSSALSNAFQDEMKQISLGVLEFFCLCEKKGDVQDLVNLEQEFIRIHAALVDRIQREEELLYQEYERVKSSTA